MTRWRDKLEAIGLKATIAEVRSRVRRSVKGLEAGHRAEIRRFHKLLEAAESGLTAEDSEIFYIKSAETLKGRFESSDFKVKIDAYTDNPTEEGLKDINDTLDSFRELFTLARSADESTAKHAAVSMEKDYDEFTRAMDEKLQAAEAQLAALNSKVEELSSSAEEIESNFSEIKVEVATFLTASKTEFTEAQNQRSKEFSDAQIARNNDFNSWQKKFQSEKDTKIDELISKKNSELSSLLDEFSQKIEELESDGREKHESILSLHKLVGVDSVRAGYLTSADSEGKYANRWRAGAIAFIVATSCWLVYTYIFASPTQDIWLHWPQMLKVASLSAVLIFGAVYASRQSALHRNNERDLRQFALEVQAFDPFVASLSEEKRNALKERLSERLFGRPRASESEKHSIDAGVAKVLLDAVRDTVRDLSKLR